MTIENKFEQIDNKLAEWLPTYGLHVYIQDRNYEVRSISVVDDDGNKYQIWIEPSDSDLMRIHASDNKNRKWAKECSIDQLTSDLNRAYKQVENWIQEDGSKRNWV